MEGCEKGKGERRGERRKNDIVRTINERGKELFIVVLPETRVEKNRDRESV